MKEQSQPFIVLIVFRLHYAEPDKVMNLILSIGHKIGQDRGIHTMFYTYMDSQIHSPGNVQSESRKQPPTPNLIKER